MANRLDLNYFYGPESDQFNFIRMPKALFFDPVYRDIVGFEEAVVYSLLLDRMNLSLKNGWYDELGRAYVHCSIDTIMEFARCKKNKAGEILKNLDAIGLIDKVLIPGRGLKIYVKNFIPKNGQEFEKQTLEKEQEPISELIEGCKEAIDGPQMPNDSDEPVYFSNDPVDFSNRPVDFSNDPAPKNNQGVVYFSNTNNNKINNTNNINTKSNQTLSVVGSENGCDEDEMGYAEIIRENIDLDMLLERYPYDKDFIQGLYDLILETVLCKSETIVVASNEYSTNFVKAKFLKLNYMHIEYIMDSWSKNTEKPRNVKKYLLAALFNAPSTMDACIQAEVNHDMAYGTV
ncbi:DUF6017 domain-containing protein [Butyrivibrio sp. VCD2006]|uniref:DUF6017 domain-containing protein n=1 Tax=Butyrivibrio sp. VCD2006 TaxID=1280664 RepID=UPI0003FE6604|nr:DUF6017 domain-containing protein [Butyrivibrio sp. VCD2006]